MIDETICVVEILVEALVKSWRTVNTNREFLKANLGTEMFVEGYGRCRCWCRAPQHRKNPTTTVSLLVKHLGRCAKVDVDFL